MENYSKKKPLLSLLAISAIMASCTTAAAHSSNVSDSVPVSSTSGVTLSSSGLSSSVGNPSSTSSSDPIKTSTSISSTSASSSNSGNNNNDGDTVAAFSRVYSVYEIDTSKKFVIAAKDSNDIVAMTTTPASDKLPWYISGEKVTVQDEKIALKSGLTVWTLSENNGFYSFKTANKSLQGYVDGKHYSINVGDNSGYSDNWSITINNGEAVFKNERNVYLEWYSNHFCGYSKETKVYLYQEDGTVTLGGSGNGGKTDGPAIDDDILGDKRWDGVDFSLYGEAFRDKLGSLITGKLTSYSDCLNVGAKAAAYPNENSKTFIPFYHDAAQSEVATLGQCNREHTWPKSRGGDLIEKDPLIIRQALSKENSSRGNSNYGFDGWDPASCGFEGARGESARVILYAATRYGKAHGLTLSNNKSNSKSMGTLKDLLAWNAQYPPTDFEKLVNNRYEKMGYARNPFVDHPSFANYIWDNEGLRTSAYLIPDR